MDQLLKPDKFDVDPTCIGAEAKWKHWKRTFSNFLSEIPETTVTNKFSLLCNYISSNVFQYINDSEDYDAAVAILDSTYITKRNEIFARHCLASRMQETGESVTEFLQILKQLSKDCNFKSVTAEQYKNEYIRDSFIRGLRNPRIRERLLENTTVTLENAFDQARALELAESHSASYANSPSHSMPVAATDSPNNTNEEIHSAAARQVSKCFFCGNNFHARNICPAKDTICRRCGKQGHYQRVCKSKPQRASHNSTASVYTLASLATSPICLQKSITKARINGIEFDALIDTGSSLSFLNERLIKMCNIRVKPYFNKITMANSSLSADVKSCCKVTMKLQAHEYKDVTFLIMKNLCADILIGHDILKDHSSIEIRFDGEKPPLQICSLTIAQVPPVSLFANLTPDCKPIATKLRRQTEEDRLLISKEVQKLLQEGVIEHSNSPWRAQAFVVRGDNHKPRMVIDYSQTINRFTMLDAYPLPRIEELISKISQYEVFSTIDLRSAYHQLPIKDTEKHYTAFEADGKLYHFLRVPFGVTNGVACFQRVIDKIIQDEHLQGTFPYLDDVTVCGRNKEEHDVNLQKFLKTAAKYNLTLNEEKCRFSTKSVKLLGYAIENRTIKPDPDRLSPLVNLPIPNNTASLRRALGMFAHYCRWIPLFSKRVRPLLSNQNFPLSEEAVHAFNSLKSDIVKASLTAIDDTIPFRVETDASKFAIGATLSQAGRPIAFFSRTLNKSEINHSSVEKEAYAIVESLRFWRHFLIGRPFEVFTDQRSVSFMFDKHHTSKIKNEKITRWKLELSCFKFDIIYRPGRENVIADAFSRITAATNYRENLKQLHEDLCHPGIIRMHHWVRSKNLPFSLEEIRGLINSCPVCCEVKPRFVKHQGILIKATSPFERLNLDFKGPLPSNTRNRFILTIVDEYSRFPFAIPCPDVSSATVINNLNNIFSIFGMPAYIHTDRGSSFMSKELKVFLTSLGIATSRTTAYNPKGNGQVEKYNGTIWKTIQLALKTKNKKIELWEEVLQPALHSVRSLLCTATNETPHERMFTHPRRSYNGISIPTWLSQPGPVLMRNNFRTNKYEPLVQEVELLEANPEYAFVRFPDGRETSVSLRHLAPRGEDVRPVCDETNDAEPSFIQCEEETLDSKEPNQETEPSKSALPNQEPEQSKSSLPNQEPGQSKETCIPKRPHRLTRQPAYLADYFVYK